MVVINFDPTTLPGADLPPDGPITLILIVAFGIACAFAFVIWID